MSPDVFVTYLPGRSQTRLSVGIAAVTNGNDIDQALAIGDPVNDAPLADTDAPKICSALKLDHSRRARVGHKRLDLLDDPPPDLWIKVL